MKFLRKEIEFARLNFSDSVNTIEEGGLGSIHRFQGTGKRVCNRSDVIRRLIDRLSLSLSVSVYTNGRYEIVFPLLRPVRFQALFFEIPAGRE